MRWIAIVVCTATLMGSRTLALAQGTTQSVPILLKAPPSAKAAPTAKSSAPVEVTAKSLLPGAFAGWVAADPPTAIPDAAHADNANAAALKEYDFAGGAVAGYKRRDETLTVRLLRFSDASGAYGAYSFYRQNGWPREDIGTGATSNHNRVLFWQGDLVVDAAFSQIGPLSAAELRELASTFRLPQGTRALSPPILEDLPSESLDKQTTHYALGPAGYAGAGGVLPPGLVGFDRGAEAVTANYSLRSGAATLTIIDYPTPQMAAAQENLVRSYIKAGNQAQPPWPKPLTDSDQASLEVRRSGPLVVLVSGDAIPDESHKLLESVHFESSLIGIPQPTESEVAKTGQLLIGIVTLVLIGSSAAILLGFFLGGGRALYRIARGKPASSVYETEFIQLNLGK